MAADAPVQSSQDGWLLACLCGEFTLLIFGAAVPTADANRLADAPIPCAIVQVGGPSGEHARRVLDAEGLAATRYDARPGTCYLLRPDQHVCARWRAFDRPAVEAAIARATGNR